MDISELPSQQQFAKEQTKPEPPTYRERGAKVIAYVLVGAFVVLLFVPFVYLFLFFVKPPYPGWNSTADAVSETTDLLKTVSAVLSGLVGSVVTYYFGVERAATRSTGQQSGQQPQTEGR